MKSKVKDIVDLPWYSLFPNVSDVRVNNNIEQYDIIDEYGFLEVLMETEEVEKKTKTNNLFQRIYHSLRNDLYTTILLLFILGCFTCIFSVFVDWAISNVQLMRNYLSSITPYFIVNYAIYMVYCIVFAVLSVACVENISPNSPGSGIPEMKAMVHI
jgi:hypothetical protein